MSYPSACVRSSFKNFFLSLGAVSSLSILSFAVPSAAQTKLPGSDSCAKFGERFQSSNDLVAMESYRSAIREMVEDEDFSQLDCIADSARVNKTRFAGGNWQLQSFYRGVSEIPGHPTEEDWNQRVDHLKKWQAENPKSITAPVALAEAYINFAWHARGDGYSSTVTASGWRLFGQRIEEARKILDDASALPAKCPHWYVSMQTIARAAGWDLSESTELLNEATALAPDYYYFYRSRAVYLLPKWEGEEGDAAKFAEDSANRVGGSKGDILYFRIGEKVVCACADVAEFRRFSWARLQKGYEATEKEYGSSISDLNTLALMATKNDDSVAADAAFQRIGNDYDVEKWITNDYFKEMKDWASDFAPMEAHARKIKAEAEANLLAPDGPAYQKNTEQALASIVQACEKEATDKAPFQFMLQIGADGMPKDVWAQNPTAVAQCVLKTAYESKTKKAAIFAKPPHPDYWMKFAFDPATSVAVK